MTSASGAHIGSTPHAPVGLHFHVAYTASEYRGFVLEHLAAVLTRLAAAKGRPFRGLSPVTRWSVAAFASMVFVIKRRAMPICEFTIDDRRIQRDTRQGRMVAAWSEVLAIHRYSHGYLIELSRGGIPVPHRCLDAAQAAELERIIEGCEVQLLLKTFGNNDRIHTQQDP